MFGKEYLFQRAADVTSAVTLWTRWRRLEFGVELCVHFPRARLGLSDIAFPRVAQSILDDRGFGAIAPPRQRAKNARGFRVQPKCNCLTHVLHGKTEARICQAAPGFLRFTYYAMRTTLIE